MRLTIFVHECEQVTIAENDVDGCLEITFGGITIDIFAKDGMPAINNKPASEYFTRKDQDNADV